jgi:3-deoxy-manno-octulosonate cytidylyltransferase (CMP-KDO synthetase)
MSLLKAIAIIPARFESTRFPGKPLAQIDQKPMIQHVYERACAAKNVDEVIVATDDARILHAVESFGGVARMTSRSHVSGTDRVAEVASHCDAQIILNLQGDEPLIDPACLDAVIDPFYSEPELMISTMSCPGKSEAEHFNPHVVKVVVDTEGFALYFSRSPIPYFRYSGTEPQPRRFLKHLGLYVYRSTFLEKLPSLKPSFLERAEGLEQLRFLENGYRIKVINTNYESLAVDTPADLERVNAFIKERSWQPNSSS